MAKDRGENALGISTGEGIFVGVANAGGLDFNQHLAGAGPIDVEGFQAERLARFAGDGCACFHDVTSQVAGSRYSGAAKSAPPTRKIPDLDARFQSAGLRFLLSIQTELRKKRDH